MDVDWKKLIATVAATATVGGGVSVPFITHIMDQLQETRSELTSADQSEVSQQKKIDSLQVEEATCVNHPSTLIIRGPQGITGMTVYGSDAECAHAKSTISLLVGTGIIVDCIN